MTNLLAWDTTPANNSTVAGVSVAEGCAAANLNNGIRGTMAEVAKYVKDTGGVLASTGSSSDYILATNQGIASIAEPLVLMFAANHTCDASGATLAVDGLSSKAIKRVDGGALQAADITSGGLYMVAYEQTADCFFLLNPTIPAALDTSSFINTGKAIAMAMIFG